MTQSARFKHQVVASDILARIENGEFPVGSKVPSVDDLVDSYPYSRMTVFKALQELTNDGYLRVERGVGTFVERTRATGCVGFVISDDVLPPDPSPFACLLMRECKDVLARAGHTLKLFVEDAWNASQRSVEVPGLEEDLTQGRLCGLITAGGNLPQYIDRWPVWARTTLPIVDVSVHDTISHRVRFDNVKALELVIDFAGREGRSVGVFGVVPALQKQFFSQAEAAGLRVNSAWCPGPIPSESAEISGYRATLACLDAGPPPDCLYVGDDIVAKGVIQALLQRQVDVPGKHRVITHYNQGSNVFYPLPVAKINYDITQVAEQAWTLLSEQLHNPQSLPRHSIVRPELLVETEPVATA